MEHDAIRIGQLAKLLGTTAKTLRFYESIGLLKSARRSESGYRLYDRNGVNRARLVIGLRHLDLSIEELQNFVREDHDITPRQRLLALMDEKLRQIYMQLSILQGRCDDLSARHQALLSTPRDHLAECICGALFLPCDCARKLHKKPETVAVPEAANSSNSA